MPAKKSAAVKRVAAPSRSVERPFRIGFLVHDVSRMRRTVFDQATRPLGLTRSQWWVLANLSRHEGGGMMQTELARILDVGKVTVGGLIDRLEASGHVERRADAEDRRAKRIFITPKGHTVIEQMAKLGTDLNDIILAGVRADDIKITEEVLHQIKENLRDHLNRQGMVAGDDED